MFAHPSCRTLPVFAMFFQNAGLPAALHMPLLKKSRSKPLLSLL